VQSGIHQLDGAYQLCVNGDGHVGLVRPVRSLGAAYDEAIMAAMRTWTFQPIPSPTCSVVWERFTLGD
jgi:hypothetical protein